jgi:hypothetical protein
LTGIAGANPGAVAETPPACNIDKLLTGVAAGATELKGNIDVFPADAKREAFVGLPTAAVAGAPAPLCDPNI